jgi:hypothetical protein
VERRDPWQHFDADTEASREAERRREEARQRDEERERQASKLMQQPSQQPQSATQRSEKAPIVVPSQADKKSPSPSEPLPASLAEIQQQELAKARASGPHSGGAQSERGGATVPLAGGRGGKPSGGGGEPVAVDAPKSDPLRRLWDMSFVSDDADKQEVVACGC